MQWLKEFVSSDKGMSGWEKLTEWASKILPTLHNIFTLINVAVRTLINFITSGGIGRIIDTIVNTWNAMSAALPRILSDAWTNLKQVFELVFAKATNLFAGVVYDLLTGLNDMMFGLKVWVANALPGFASTKKKRLIELTRENIDDKKRFSKNYNKSLVDTESLAKKASSYETSQLGMTERWHRTLLDHSTTKMGEAVKNGFADAASKVTFSSKDAFMEKLWNFIEENGGIKIAEDTTL